MSLTELGPASQTAAQVPALCAHATDELSWGSLAMTTAAGGVVAFDVGHTRLLIVWPLVHVSCTAAPEADGAVPTAGRTSSSVRSSKRGEGLFATMVPASVGAMSRPKMPRLPRAGASH